jgi:hypothetical protein
MTSWKLAITGAMPDSEASARLRSAIMAATEEAVLKMEKDGVLLSAAYFQIGGGEVTVRTKGDGE